MEKITGLSRYYDFVLIDCPPNLGLLTFNALRAAKEAIIPVDCSIYALHGLSKIIETIRLLKEAVDHSVRARPLINDVDTTTCFSWKIRMELEEKYAHQLLRTQIHHSIRLREAALVGKPITDFDRQCPVFQDFMQLSGELLEVGLQMPSLNWKEPFAVDHLYTGNPEDQIESQPKEPDPQAVLLMVKAPQAVTVQVAGDFNHWIPEAMVPPIKWGGLWRKLYHMPDGIYKYRFLVDGEWICDPRNNRKEPNPFGGYDSVIQVGNIESLTYGK